MDESDAEKSAGVRGPLLLSQLKLILDSDPLIDELGFIHPDQLISLHAVDASRNESLASVSETDQTATTSVSKSEGDSHSHPASSLRDDADHRELKGPGSSETIDCPPTALHSQDDNPLESALLGLKEDPGSVFETMSPSPSRRQDCHSLSNSPGQNESRANCSSDGKKTSSIRDGHPLSLPYDPSAFWCGEHKLAISILALAPIYLSAHAAFMTFRSDYEKFLQAERQPESAEWHGSSFDTVSGGDLAEVTGQNLEDNLLSYSRALVLVNCDHASAWSSRKRIIQKRVSGLKFLTEELHLATLVLSRGPKSEETWAHRRWVINRIVTSGITQSGLDSVLEDESKLVEAVAGKSSMNYRAWRHRCWLVPQMSSVQIAIELNRTKLWARSHIADNCCFHYRRVLLLQLTEFKVSKENEDSHAEIAARKHDLNALNVVRFDGSEIRTVWKEEMNWSKKLIERYKGREALWIHLRFLLLIWVYHLGSGLTTSKTEPLPSARRKVLRSVIDLDIIAIENTFSDNCLSACALEQTDDGQKQQEFAASYKLWTLTLGSRIRGKTKNECTATDWDHLLNVQQLLHEVAPYRNQLWDGLVANFQRTSL